MKKLSPAQQHVLDRMAEGWELATSTSRRSEGIWLQQGGIGEEDQFEDVLKTTVSALLEQGLICMKKRGLPATTWRLTEAGRLAGGEVKR